MTEFILVAAEKDFGEIPTLLGLVVGIVTLTTVAMANKGESDVWFLAPFAGAVIGFGVYFGVCVLVPTPGYADAHGRNIATVGAWLSELDLSTTPTDINRIAERSDKTITLTYRKNELEGRWVGNKFEVSGIEADSKTPLVWQETEAESRD